MNNLNFFNSKSIFFPLRWLISICLALIITMSYANLVGWKIFTSNNQEKWSASGPGTHK